MTLQQITLHDAALPRHDLEALMHDIQSVSVAVLGDFCLDVYWFTDLSAAELSLETGLETRPVRRAHLSLGAAGNVAANLLALGCRRIEAFGVVGCDIWGREMLHLLRESGVGTSGMLSEPRDWSTLVYVKPHIQDKETSRFDFGNFNRLPAQTARTLIGALVERLDEFDAVLINEQVTNGLHSAELRQALAEAIQRHPGTNWIVDSRHFPEAYPGASLKINDLEATRLLGIERPAGALVPREEALAAAEALGRRMGRPVYVTRRDRGVIVHDGRAPQEIPGLLILGRIDPVGAGDSMLAGIAAAIAAGRSPVQAATLGNFVAGVTIQKLYVTGTASPDEVLRLGAEPDYVYRPELAEDPRGAVYYDGAEIEIVSRRSPAGRPTIAIFDHDGTISTLRQGWEAVMEPMMIRAILGEQYQSADESLYHQVVDRVREYIDHSTGIQTLLQMQGLVRMVREFGCVPEGQILDEFGYKAIYNEALMAMVSRRLAKLERGELQVEDFLIKNAWALLERLRDAGVRLCLASGTDQEDVRREARALGYADLFDGGIWGSVGDVNKDAKRIVLDRIMNEIGDAGMAGLVTFGDGPVEMRETRRRGGFAIGVASDEIRRYGLNLEKRSRLIRSGADLIVPDFSQLDRLLDCLNL